MSNAFSHKKDWTFIPAGKAAAYPSEVTVTSTGSLSVDPNKLLVTEDAKRQVGALRELAKSCTKPQK